MTRNFVWFIVVCALLSTACSKGSKVEAMSTTKKADPVQVSVAEAKGQKLEKSLLVTGSLLADESVTVSPEVAGRVTAIRADFGQMVRKGDVVAELDRTEYQLQVERAKAALNQALARMGIKPGEEMAPPKSTANLRQAQARLEDAKFKYESAAKLVKTGDISQERFTELEKAYHAQQAAFESVQDDVRTTWASAESMRADVRLAEKRLNDTVLRAPFDGSVSQKNVSVGQYVKDNTAILTLVKTSPLRLRVDVPESSASAVRPGSELVFTTDALRGVELRATVRELNPSLDSRNRSLTVEARLSNPDNRLRPGMFVQVRLITDKAGDSVMVPRKAVYSIAGLTKVFVVQGGKAVEKKVEPGRELDGWMEVPADLVRAGDSVATSNLAMLSNGTEVRVSR